MDMDYKKMGARMRVRRKEKTLTQERVSELCEISLPYYSHIENGSARPSLEIFFRIARVLDVTPDYFLTDTAFSSKAYLKDDIARRLDQCTPKSMRLVRKVLDAIIEEQASENGA